LTSVRQRLVQRGLRLLDASHALLGGLQRHERTQRLVAFRLALGFFEGRAVGGDGGFGLPERERVAVVIDLEQDLAAPHRLVVDHQHLGDQAGDVGRDLDHLGADPAVPRPGLDLVVGPQPARRDHRQGHDGEGDGHAGGVNEKGSRGGHVRIAAASL
jgi:hypothetical protein